MNFLKALQYFAAALIFVLVAVYLSSRISGGQKQTTVISNSTQPTVVTCSPDFNSYLALSKDPNHVTELISQRKSMFAKDGAFINSQVIITKSETEHSKVACGYLFVRAGTTFGPLKKWENVYINPSNFGGHIDPKGQIGVGDGNNFSEYVFPLNNITYWKNLTDHAQGSVSKADWAALLNVSDKVAFDIALNTEDKTGFIDKLSIAYKCWDPSTGQENSDCKINIIDSSDTQTSQLK